jgi:hypothetical protein
MTHFDPNQYAGKKENTDVANRRRAPRKQVKGSVHLKVDAQDLTGEADNISRSGILFFTEGDLHVELEIESGGEMVKRTGRLVRCERIHDSRRGWAVEFDG